MLRMSVLMALVVGAVLCLDLARVAAGLAVRMYEAAPHILPNLLLKLRWGRAQRNLEVSFFFSPRCLAFLTDCVSGWLLEGTCGFNPVRILPKWLQSQVWWLYRDNFLDDGRATS